MNPILDNHLVYQDTDEKIQHDRKIVYIDVTKSDEVIWAEYNRHTRKNIKKAKKEGLSVYRSNNIEKDMDKFVEIYHASMDRKEAGKFYYFNDQFFNELTKWFKDEISLFFVEYKNEIITASLELGKFGILHDYLRGAKPEFNQYRPTELLIDEIAKWTKTTDYNYFVIGGGNTNSENDNLLRFKKKLSPGLKDFYLYKKIHNFKIYKSLCQDVKINDDLKLENASFFPEYRMKTT
jgi:lipid II:glycine glycyltransferase (peptidoglycan interpeptide bridge formation enzyme)